MNRKCSICPKKYYAKGYCKNHYTVFLRSGNPLGLKQYKKIKCVVSCCLNEFYEELNKKYRKYNEYCPHHRIWASKGWREGIDRRKEKENINWRGGISEYKNHSLMKKNRIIKLKNADNVCEMCGGYAKEVHHIDKKKDNHSMDNLAVLCRRCHKRKHKKGLDKGF